MAYIALILYAVFIIAIANTFKDESKTKEAFLAGDRNITPWPMAMSIAATWIWAPALFVSAEKAYLNGIVGITWFVVPNILTLLIFIPFAIKIRNQMPRGYTLSGYMRERYSNRVKNIYVFQLSFLALLSTVVQLLAGGKVLSLMVGMPFWLTTLLLGLFAYYYSKDHGIKASIRTDAVQMVMILLACIVFVPWALNLNGFDSMFRGMSGLSGEYGNLFDAKGFEIFLAYGIPTAIGLLSGPFGDQNFWQRAFSMKKQNITKTFTLAAILFAIVPISMAILGFIAAGNGFIPNDAGIVNFELVTSMFPPFALWIFMFMLLSGLLSTIDSNICSVAGLATDVKKDPSIRYMKNVMLALVLIATVIANIPGVSIFHLFLIYGILRAVTLLTTACTLMGVKLHEAGVFYGVFASLLISFPIFVYGNLNNILAFKIGGSISAPLLSIVVALVITQIKNKGVRNA